MRDRFESRIAGRSLRRSRRRLLISAAVLLGLTAATLFRHELESSTWQSRLIADYAADIGHWLEPGTNPEPARSAGGPYDQRFGYTQLPQMLERLTGNGYRIVAQARVSDRFRESTERGLFPVFAGKSQAGLTIVDRTGQPLFERAYPEFVLAGFEAVPPVIVDTLLHIENRGLLDPQYPHRNPALDWRRFLASLMQYGHRSLGADVPVAGASTLATQLEKFRHSEQGITSSPAEKLRQMATASVRAFHGGRDTLEARRRIVSDYLNGVPLSAVPGRGEVNGLLDGLRYWYGIETDRLTELADPIDPARLTQIGETYRAALSLIVASRAPTVYLASPGGPKSLAQLTDAYLRRLARDQVIDPRLATAALDATITPRVTAPRPQPDPFVNRKAVNAARTELLTLLGTPSLYELDRYDLTVRVTIDGSVQRAVSEALTAFDDPHNRLAAGLTGARLLPAHGPVDAIYSLLLYQATPSGNLLRVRADSFDGPLDVNSQTQLELGSTAKLRTLISYLEIIEALHTQLAGMDAAERARYIATHRDPLTAWAGRQFGAEPQLTVDALLAAALARRYSASPHERFFTAGGMHRFSNFDTSFDDRQMSVSEAFRHSVNLPFIRMMRDIVEYHVQRLPDAPTLSYPQHPARVRLLERFADHEGRQFVTQYYRRHFGADLDEQIALLLGGRAATPQRLARLYRALEPEADVDALGAFLDARLNADARTGFALESLYRNTAADGLHLADLAHLAGVHPLELWVARMLIAHPEASLSYVLDVSADARQQAYRWLFRTSRRTAQNQRIRTILEIDAFAAIHAGWQRLGYPFASLVPSYATAIGSSADNPQALAELIGIIVNDGLRLPLVTIEELHFAAGTPFETLLQPAPLSPGASVPKASGSEQRVLSPDFARAVRAELIGVVEDGTGRRVHNTLSAPQGQTLEIGGKTGTGDNQVRALGSDGRLIASRPLNRTSALAFFAGDYFGIIVAYVGGPASAEYRFTSALPAQILRHLAPVLEPLLDVVGTSTAATVSAPETKSVSVPYDAL